MSEDDLALVSTLMSFPAGENTVVGRLWYRSRSKAVLMELALEEVVEEDILDWT